MSTGERVEGATRSTQEGVMDPRTRLLVFKMVNAGTLLEVQYVRGGGGGGGGGGSYAICGARYCIINVQWVCRSVPWFADRLWRFWRGRRCYPFPPERRRKSRFGLSVDAVSDEYS